MTKEEYIKARDVFMKEQYNKEPQKPNGMFGHWGWYLKKEREFKKLLETQGIKLPKLGGPN
jgi:hypothetical protein